MPRVDYLYRIASVRLDGNGNGSCYVSPDVGQYWAATLTRVATVTQGAATRPHCAIYQGAVQLITPSSFIDDTEQGDSDSSSMISGTTTQFGEAITAVWTGGIPGDTATLVVMGTSSDTPPAFGYAIPVVPGAHFSGHQTFAMQQLANIIALAISNQGVPAIDHPVQIAVVINDVIAAGGSTTYGHIVTGPYQSVVGTMFAQEQVGGGLGTTPYTRVTFDWSVASQGYSPLIEEDWVIANGPTSFVSNYRNDYASPCYGDALTITAHNLDSKAIVFTYVIFGSYRARSRSFLRGRYPDDHSNPTNGFGSDDVIISANPGNILTGTTTANFLMQLWEGPATIGAFMTGAPAAGTVAFTVVPQPETGVEGLGSKYQFHNDFPDILTPTTLILPRRVCTLRVTNNSGVTITPTITVTGQVQPN